MLRRCFYLAAGARWTLVTESVKAFAVPVQVVRTAALKLWLYQFGLITRIPLWAAPVLAVPVLMESNCLRECIPALGAFSGPLYYIFMTMLGIFSTNAINILAGVNGLEVTESACAHSHHFSKQVQKSC